MFEEFFDKCEIQNPEKISEQQSEKIKTSLQKKLAANNSQPKKSTKEEKIMKTSTTIRSIMLAAAVAALGAVSVIVSANTVPVSNQVLPENDVTVSGDGELDEISFTVTGVDEETGDVKITVDPDGTLDTDEVKTKEEMLKDIEEYLKSSSRSDIPAGNIPKPDDEVAIMNELKEKNQFTDEFAARRYNVTEQHKNNPNGEHGGGEAHISPSYRDMIINDLIVTEVNRGDMKIMLLSGEPTGIVLKHEEEWGGSSTVLLPDGNGGYVHCNGNPIDVDEQLAAAIAEGVEKYGDTFAIWY